MVEFLVAAATVFSVMVLFFAWVYWGGLLQGYRHRVRCQDCGHRFRVKDPLRLGECIICESANVASIGNTPIP